MRTAAWPYLSDKDALQHVLSKLIERFLPELFVLVTDPKCPVTTRMPSDNNAAERSLRQRSLRSSVIARKISGGTRSEQGSKSRTTQRTLFGTGKLQDKDLLETCHQMLLSVAPAPQPAPS